MSHNTHYILINAEDVENAQYKVESELMNFGNENNWSSVERVINVTDETSKDYLQEELDYLNKHFTKDYYQKRLDNIKSFMEQADENHRHFFYMAKCDLEEVYEVSAHINHEPYTIEDLQKGEINDYFGYSYDNYGITNLVYEPLENEHIYFVEIDIHS